MICWRAANVLAQAEVLRKESQGYFDPQRTDANYMADINETVTSIRNIYLKDKALSSPSN
jgi:hypothetical protein